jgi:hypothetical protein
VYLLFLFPAIVIAVLGRGVNKKLPTLDREAKENYNLDRKISMWAGK